MRLFFCLMCLLVLTSCNNQTMTPDYPLSIMSSVNVENNSTEYKADFSFGGSRSAFLIKEPMLLYGMEVEFQDDAATVLYHGIKLDYENMSEKFTIFSSLHNSLVWLNKIQPEFIKSGDRYYCESEYNGAAVRFEMDEEKQLDSVAVGNLKFNFD